MYDAVAGINIRLNKFCSGYNRAFRRNCHVESGAVPGCYWLQNQRGKGRRINFYIHLVEDSNELDHLTPGSETTCISTIRRRSSAAKSLSKYSRSRGSRDSHAEPRGINRVSSGVELRNPSISGVSTFWKYESDSRPPRTVTNRVRQCATTDGKIRCNYLLRSGGGSSTSAMPYTTPFFASALSLTSFTPPLPEASTPTQVEPSREASRRRCDWSPSRPCGIGNHGSGGGSRGEESDGNCG